MYTDFAEVYDRLSKDVDYSKWADYYEKLFRKFGCLPSLVLDIGCGSGNLTSIMHKRGYDMIGADSSIEMLSRAKQKDKDILYLNMDACDFELYGTVDAVISSFDLINYIENPEKMFALVNNYLNYGGLFIFDISTPYKLENVLGNNTFVYDEDDIFYAWENSFDGKKCEMTLNIFVGEEKKYKRVYEYQTQYAHTREQIEKHIKNAGLNLLGVFGDLSEEAPKKDSERIFFVAERRKRD